MTVKEAMNSVMSPSGKSEVYQLDKLLSDDFIRSETDCANADALLSGLNVKNQQEFDDLDIAVLDRMVSDHSATCRTFSELISAAVQWYRRQS